MKTYGEFQSCRQMTVGELKKRLSEYPEDARIFMESSNASNSGDTLWAQKLLDTYNCEDFILDEHKEFTKKKALMMVGSLR